MGESASGHKCHKLGALFQLTISSFVVPGVLQIVASFNCLEKLIEVSVFEFEGRWIWPILACWLREISTIRSAGEILTLHTKVKKTLRGESALMTVYGTVDGQKTCELNCYCIQS